MDYSGHTVPRDIHDERQVRLPQRTNLPNLASRSRDNLVNFLPQLLRHNVHQNLLRTHIYLDNSGPNLADNVRGRLLEPSHNGRPLPKSNGHFETGRVLHHCNDVRQGKSNVMVGSVGVSAVQVQGCGARLVVHDRAVRVV
jgi:hypothetical protein